MAASDQDAKLIRRFDCEAGIRVLHLGLKKPWIDCGDPCRKTACRPEAELRVDLNISSLYFTLSSHTDPETSDRMTYELMHG